MLLELIFDARFLFVCSIVSFECVRRCCANEENSHLGHFITIIRKIVQYINIYNHQWWSLRNANFLSLLSKWILCNDVRTQSRKCDNDWEETISALEKNIKLFMMMTIYGPCTSTRALLHYTHFPVIFIPLCEMNYASIVDGKNGNRMCHQ